VVQRLDAAQRVADRYDGIAIAVLLDTKQNDAVERQRVERRAALRTGQEARCWPVLVQGG